MKPENILQSHVLDIIFENKNKDYGAYELRTKYNKRLVKSIGFTTAIVILFALLQSWKIPHKTSRVETYLLKGEVVLTNYEIQENKLKPKQIERPKSSAPKPSVPTEILVPPVLTKDPIITQIATVDKLENAMPGDTKSDGDGKLGSDIPPATGTGGKGLTETKSAPVEPEVYSPAGVQKMAEYPGGMEALKTFILKNVRQPDDLEEGEKFVIIATFVVDKQGDIVKVEISKSGRKDLDAEVIRLVKRMPQWKPAMQNDHPVSVYFKLPITFATPD
jgi:protein TonB